MFIVGLVTMLFLGYWAGKYFGYWEGLCNRNPLVIKKCNDPTNHFCNVVSHNVVCFEFDIHIAYYTICKLKDSVMESMKLNLELIKEEHERRVKNGEIASPP